jgi:hypothetical protein
VPKLVSVVDREDTPESGSPTASKQRDTRAAAAVFAVFIPVAAWALVAYLGNYFWFGGDEWHFLVARDAGDIGNLLHPHNEHISVLPILVYRALWHLFGLRSYVPYQLCVIALHLTVAVLLRAVMRRSGVNPWIATAAASVFVLFGPGEENIIWAFQIGFTGTLAFGLAQLLLADHAGPVGRRDWAALGFGVLALLSSGLSPLTTAVVGAVVLVRRGWRPALVQTIPLGVAFVAWWITIGPDQITDPYKRSTDWGQIVQFVRDAVVATFEGLAAGSALLAALYGVVLVAGLGVAWSTRPRAERLRDLMMPLSLLVAGLAFLVISGYGRWWVGGDVAGSSRYVHLAAAFSLPALAVAFDALARLWRSTLMVAVASIVLATTIPYGISQFEETNPFFNGAYLAARRELVASLAESTYVDDVPHSTRPDPGWSPITVGWLADARSTGDLPAPGKAVPADDPTFRLRFGLTALDAAAPNGNCETFRGPVDVSLRRGDELGVYVGPWSAPRDNWYFRQQYTMQLLADGEPVGSSLAVHPGYGHLLRAELDDLDVRFGLFPGTEAFILCRTYREPSRTTGGR